MSDQIPPTYYSNNPQWQGQPQNTVSNPYNTQSNEYASPPAYAQPNAYPQPALPPNEPVSGVAIAGLIVGIVGLCICWVPVLGLLAGVAGIILSAIGQRRSQSSRVLAIIGLVLSIITAVVCLCVTGSLIAGIISASRASTY